MSPRLLNDDKPSIRIIGAGPVGQRFAAGFSRRAPSAPTPATGEALRTLEGTPPARVCFIAVAEDATPAEFDFALQAVRAFQGQEALAIVLALRARTLPLRRCVERDALYAIADASLALPRDNFHDIEVKHFWHLYQCLQRLVLAPLQMFRHSHDLADLAEAWDCPGVRLVTGGNDVFADPGDRAEIAVDLAFPQLLDGGVDIESLEGIVAVMSSLPGVMRMEDIRRGHMAIRARVLPENLAMPLAYTDDECRAGMPDWGSDFLSVTLVAAIRHN